MKLCIFHIKDLISFEENKDGSEYEIHHCKCGKKETRHRIRDAYKKVDKAE